MPIREAMVDYIDGVINFEHTIDDDGVNCSLVLTNDMCVDPNSYNHDVNAANAKRYSAVLNACYDCLCLVSKCPDLPTPLHLVNDVTHYDGP